MKPGGIILGLDPSSTCIGYGALTRTGHLYDVGIITPGDRRDGSWDRIIAMHADLVTLLDSLRPDSILVEWTRGKVGQRHKGLGAGLAVYGCGVGAVGIAVYQWAMSHADCEVQAICENDWTRGVPKASRQLAVASLYPAYAEHISEDPGGDIADAIGLVDWWIRERRAEGRLFE